MPSPSGDEPRRWTAPQDSASSNSVAMTGNHGRKPAFPPQETNLGGAHLILGDYVSLHRRAASAGPTREVLRTKTIEPTLQAQRLSANRAARRAVFMDDHFTHLYHLSRRIQDMYLPVERQKNVHDATVYPVLQARRGAHTTSALHAKLTAPWKQGLGYSTLDLRPKAGSGPSGWPSRQRRRSAETYQGWSVTSNLRDTFWGDEFPLQRRKASTFSPRALNHAAYKEAIMREVVSRRLYKATDLRHLFRHFLTLAPIHDKEVVQEVVDELKRELVLQ